MDNWSKKDLPVGRRQAALPSGTTIMELLVVTSIVAVLGVAFIPVLQQGRAASSEVQCTANLKRLGLASVYYNNDYNQFIVPRHAPNNKSDPEIHQTGFKLLLLPYLNGGTPLVKYIPASVTPNPGGPPIVTPAGAALIPEVLAGAVTPGTPIINPSLLLGNLNALRCPSNPNRLLASKDMVTPTSYSCNGAPLSATLFTSPGTYDRTPCGTYTRMSLVTNPSKTWLVSEGLTDEGGTYGASTGASRNSIDFAGGAGSGLSMFFGHSGTTANFVFTDGHGAPLKPTQTANTTTNMWSITPSTIARNILIHTMTAHETVQASMW